MWGSKMRTLLCAGLFLAAGAACFAQDNQEIDSLIKSGLNKNFESIQRETADLGEDERLEIYSRNQLSKWLWFGTLAPFGIGNFIQGDKAWGGMVLAGEVAGVGVLMAGAMMVLAPIIFFPLALMNPEGSYKFIEKGSRVMLAGGITWAVFQMAGVIRAFAYLPAYNKKLQRALQLDTVAMSIEPSVNSTARGVELTLASLKF